ncbi:hypothetical protein GALL_548170 [mine drainage metagenome]|uniref:UvrD-like helicase C-terminal domain-containing protein n=1 Tax=mine drainage metagenome TaxID=410659 RepID=A0A1J5NY03_9ZZZZ
MNLTTLLPKGVSRITVSPQELFKKQISLLKYWNKSGTSIALHSGDAKSKNKTHSLAKMLGGNFSSIEEVEGKVLFTFINELHSAKTVNKRLLVAVDFIKKCFAGVDKVLVSGTKKGNFAKPTASTKKTLIPILSCANSYLSEPTSKSLRDFFILIRDHPDTIFYRRDLFNRFLNILKIQIDAEAHTLLESAEMYQVDFRHLGRPIRHSKLIGTTLLVKGLEYDHAVILDGDSLDLKGLYVAMTRGSKSLTIISNQGLLPKV